MSFFGIFFACLLANILSFSLMIFFANGLEKKKNKKSVVYFPKNHK